jgi:5'-nucleotidase
MNDSLSLRIFLARVNILLTNDDGFNFDGLILAKTELENLGSVIVFAPAKDRSGTSQAISIYNDILVKEIAEDVFSVDGYPTDCVNIGLHSKLYDKEFDLIISGINKGVNMGEDTLYSGTFGAARHARVHKIPAFALSYGYSGNVSDFITVAQNCIQIISELLKLDLKETLFNINHPPLSSFTGKWKFTKLGQRLYKDKYSVIRQSDGSFLLNLGGSELDHINEVGTDFETFYNGIISVTPMTTDGTDFNLLENVNSSENQM